jgi:hypothetical protein
LHRAVWPKTEIGQKEQTKGAFMGGTSSTMFKVGRRLLKAALPVVYDCAQRLCRRWSDGIESFFGDRSGFDKDAWWHVAQDLAIWESFETEFLGET